MQLELRTIAAVYDPDQVTATAETHAFLAAGWKVFVGPVRLAWPTPDDNNWTYILYRNPA